MTSLLSVLDTARPPDCLRLYWTDARPRPPDDLTDGVLRLRSWGFDDVACVGQAGQDPDIPKGTTVLRGTPRRKGRHSSGGSTVD